MHHILHAALDVIGTFFVLGAIVGAVLTKIAGGIRRRHRRPA